MSVIVITGASAGIGRATARELAARGHDLALLAREPERLAEAAAEVESLGRRALPITLDVADAGAVEAAADQIETELGPIDAWVNNAINSVVAPVLDITPEEIQRVTEVTYLGTVYGTLAALRRMARRGRGTIVQVGSGLSFRSFPLQAPYCGAKAGVRGFTDSVRTELLHQGIPVRISAVYLPAVNTPQFSWVRSRMLRTPQPAPPVYEPEVAARAIADAVEHPRREVNLGWPVVVGRLLNGLAPGLMDRYVAATAWEGQLGDDPNAPHERPDNLDRPVRGDVAAHGAFGAKAGRWSPLYEATVRFPGLVTAAGIATLATVGILARRRSRGRRGWLPG
jgi:short-subunit dehydrogenase